MTTPAERTLNVFRVQAFLSRLMTPKEGGYKGIPSDVRKEARHLLKHYPMSCDLLSREAWDAHTVQQWGTEMDERWRKR